MIWSREVASRNVTALWDQPGPTKILNSPFFQTRRPSTTAMVITFESLPVELIADILSELDLASLITVSYLSRRIHSIVSDSSLNPWRKPILRNLRDGNYEPSFNNLCVRYVVPRQNWVEIMSLAKADFLLFQATLPNLQAREWEECFRRRFLPGWCKWRKDDMSWKEAFMKCVDFCLLFGRNSESNIA